MIITCKPLLKDTQDPNIIMPNVREAGSSTGSHQSFEMNSCFIDLLWRPKETGPKSNPLDGNHIKEITMESIGSLEDNGGFKAIKRSESLREDATSPPTNTLKVHIYWNKYVYFHEIRKQCPVKVKEVICSAITAMEKYSEIFEGTSKKSKLPKTTQERVNALNTAISILESSEPHPTRHFEAIADAPERRQSRAWKRRGESIFKSIHVVDNVNKKDENAANFAEVIFNFYNEDYDMCDNSDEDIQCIYSSSDLVA